MQDAIKAIHAGMHLIYSVRLSRSVVGTGGIAGINRCQSDWTPHHTVDAATSL